MPDPFHQAEASALGTSPLDPMMPPPELPQQRVQQATAPYVQSAIEAVWNEMTGGEGSLVRRYVEASEGLRTTGEYDPKPGVELMETLATGGAAGAEKGAIGAAGGAVKAARRAKLPMDEASRAARARELGYSRDAYRGEGKPIVGDEFIEAHPGRYDEGFLGSQGIYSASHPRIPNDYSTFKAAKVRADEAAPNVMPLKVKMKNPLQITGDDKIDIASLQPHEREAWLRDQVYGAGYDGVIVKYRDGAQEYLAPATSYRSRFAAFDPANEGSGFLLGANRTDKKTAAVAAAQLGKGPLFDYSKLHEVPDRPQVDLPRVTPARGVPEDILAAGSKSKIKQANKFVEEGIKKGGLRWYNAMPLRDAYMGELGSAKGAHEFDFFMEGMGGSSPDSVVPQNIRSASYYVWLLRNGKALPPRIKSEKGNWKVPEGEIPEGYGARAQALHVQNFENIRDLGGIPVLENPKPPSFAGNLRGNYRPVAVDRHNMRMFDIERSDVGPGYQYMEQLQQEQARKIGIEPAQYQSSGWLGAAEHTGVRTGNEPFLRMYEDEINRTASYYRMTPKEVLRDIIRGKMYFVPGKVPLR